MTVYMREDAAFVSATPKTHAQHATIQHWQLRDLVACPWSNHEVLVVNQNNVTALDTHKHTTRHLLEDIAFSPTSMTAAHDYLAAGGQRSQLAVRSLTMDWFAQTSVGGSINNALHIAKMHGGTRLLISNNDKTIKVFALPSLERVATLAFPTAVNYAAVSPDGRRLVAVGDSSDVYLYNVGTSCGEDYTPVATLRAGTDAGFSCAWNEAGDKFAVASQDGHVYVWDVRQTQRLATLDSKQGQQVSGACRNVKFSQAGGVDLLMYSEHVSFVNIVDARTFNERQTLRISAPMEHQPIAGIAFSPDTRRIFVGTEQSVFEYAVDTTSRRSFPYGEIR